MRKSISIITIFLSCLLLFSACGSEKSEVIGDFTKYNAYNANIGDSFETVRDTYGIKLTETSESTEYEGVEEFYGEKAKFQYCFDDGEKLGRVYISLPISENKDYDSLLKRYELLETKLIELLGEPSISENEQDTNSKLLVSKKGWGKDTYYVRLMVNFSDDDVNKGITVSIIG